MPQYGLIGWPLGHSFSKKYFAEKFEREGIEDVRYELFPLEHIAGLPALLAQNPELRGLNVTIPHKESAIAFLHDLDETARAVGAVNCIKVFEDQRLVGYNTDVVGFEKSLLGAVGGGWKVDPGAWRVEGRSAFVLGTGGASKAVAFVLKKLGVPFKSVSRNPRSENEIGYEDLRETIRPNSQFLIPKSPRFRRDKQFPILINTTPIGTFPHVDKMPPVPLEIFRHGLFVYDLIYNPAETLLLREAKARGCTVKNGLEMLELQAEAAWEIWQNPVVR